MKINRKQFEKLITMMVVYEEALEDISFIQPAPGLDLAEARKTLAVNALKNGMEIEKSA